MKKRMCKRCTVLLLVMALCLGSVLPVTASPQSIAQSSGMENVGVPAMDPIDISEEGMRNALMTDQQFMETFSVDEKDIVVAEEEMYSHFGMKDVQIQEVSANSISSNSAEVNPDKATYATLEDAADYLRGKMVNRSELVTVRVASSKDSALKNVTKIINKVYEYDINGEPYEGDYLYWHMKYVGWRNPVDNGDGTMTITFGFEYRSDSKEEKYVTKKINAIIKKLDLKSSALNDYEKVRRIYDEVMNLIIYDDYHYQMDQSYDAMYTTYGALDSGYAVCQAYATLFYRLCEEIGISARVICGNDDESGDPTHGWNIVKIGNVYYNLDATWDDTIASTPQHFYFLKNMNDFDGHQRNKRNAGSTFDKEFPMASVSYPLPDDDVSSKMVNVANVNGSVVLTDGSTYSLTASGKPKAILFINGGEAGSASMLESYYSAVEKAGGQCDALVVDIYNGYAGAAYGPQQMMQVITQLTSNPTRYKFSSDYSTGLVYRNQYASVTGNPQGALTSVVLVDGNNIVRYFGAGITAIRQTEFAFDQLQTTTRKTLAGIKVKQTKNNEVKISWTKYTGASRYMVYRKMGSGAYYCLGTTTKSSFTDEVKPKTGYTYQVYALSGEKEIAVSTQKSIKTKTMLLKKGKTYTVDGYKYKVLKSTSKTKTVAFKGVSNKKLTKIIIPDKVKIHGMEYKVTEIASGALKSNTKVKTVSIGANVTKIGSKAFYKAKKLANIVIKTKKLKSVGSKALSGISGKAEIRVPSSKLKKYKTLFKGKGQKSSVKIKK